MTTGRIAEVGHSEMGKEAGIRKQKAASQHPGPSRCPPPSEDTELSIRPEHGEFSASTAAPAVEGASAEGRLRLPRLQMGRRDGKRCG